MKQLLKRALERVLRARILRTLPRGLDIAHDFATNLPWLDPTVIFDVGANKGQSATMFAAWLPHAQVHAFEPVPATFAILQSRVGRLEHVHCHCLALGAAAGHAAIRVGAKPSQARIATDGGEPIEMDTVTGFCAGHGIEHIGFLKIDTEGHDLAVLHGAEELLAAQRIDAVQVEAGMHPENIDHVPLEQLKAFLESKGYRLFALYEQRAEWKARLPNLRRVNAVFISDRIMHGRG